MTEYYIRIEEDWFNSNVTGEPQSRTVWGVTSEDGHSIDQGVIGYGGVVGEKEARKRAEQAATLDAKREKAKNNRVTYEFTPEV